MTDALRHESPTPLAIGDVVAERYRIDAILGEGGMGVVYRAEHLHLRKPLALKVLLPLWSQMPEVVARFEREAIAAGSIQSPHVAGATDFGRLPDGSFFLVMEYVLGRTLREALRAGPVPFKRALRIARGIGSALQAAHAMGIVHRDLKPENVMLIEREGDPDFAKVLDFGIAKIDGMQVLDGAPASGAALTRAGTVIGTPDYMSPEQAVGQPVDARSDLYSLGVVLFEMLTGHCPFSGGGVTVLRQHVMAPVPELPADVLAGLDPRVAPLLGRLLAKSPDERFASAAELLAAIDECVPRTSSASIRPSGPPRTAAPKSGRRALVVVALGSIVLGGGIAALVLGTRRDDPAPPGDVSPAESTPAPAATPSATGTVTLPPATSETAAVVLPPPPAPLTLANDPAGNGSAHAAAPKPAASQGQARRTGPGGIYIPPPSQWFK